MNDKSELVRIAIALESINVILKYMVEEGLVVFPDTGVSDN